jgi:hypothetical protein
VQSFKANLVHGDIAALPALGVGHSDDFVHKVNVLPFQVE